MRTVALAILTFVSATICEPLELGIQVSSDSTILLTWESASASTCIDIYRQVGVNPYEWISSVAPTINSYTLSSNQLGATLLKIQLSEDCDLFNIPSDAYAAYSFEGNTEDSTGNLFHLSNYNCSYIDGLTGQAVALNGESSYLERPTYPHFDPSNGWTISVWVKAESLEGQQFIASWYNCGIVNPCNNQSLSMYHIPINNGFPGWVVRDSGGEHVGISHDETIPLEEWTHLVGTLDGVDRNTRLYVNGNISGQGQGDIGGLSGSAPLSIGRVYIQGWGTPNGYFHGAIDELKFFTRALTLVEVRSLYLQGSGG